ncbi:hypothetical protein JW899_03390 [Candidatus Uhrbacteria bacterium]|nr:hypothetical protein [Candidatus Uhrbacteria bacterium]
MSFASYFDLNRRAAGAVRETPSPLTVTTRSTIPESEEKPIRPELGKPAAAEKPAMPLWEQIVLYVGTVIGVLFSSAIMKFNVEETVDLRFSVATLAVAAVIALLVTPSAFEKLKVSPDSPFLSRLSLFAQHGVFWQVVIEALRKTIVS